MEPGLSNQELGGIPRPRPAKGDTTPGGQEGARRALLLGGGGWVGFLDFWWRAPQSGGDWDPSGARFKHLWRVLDGQGSWLRAAGPRAET